MRVGLIERRALGALAFVDAASGLPVRSALQVEGRGLKLLPKPTGEWVVLRATGLEAHGEAFAAPPKAPPLASRAYALDVRDPSGRYLARRCVVRLPRDPDPAHAGADDSLYAPQVVRLFASASAPVAPNWASVRVTVRRKPGDERIAGALVRIAPKSGAVASVRGLTDAAGEALVAVPGIPKLMASGGGGVVTDTIDARLTVIVDFASARLIRDDETLDARIAALGSRVDPPDPDELERREAQLARVQRTIKVSSGASLHLTIPVPA